MQRQLGQAADMIQQGQMKFGHEPSNSANAMSQRPPFPAAPMAAPETATLYVTIIIIRNDNLARLTILDFLHSGTVQSMVVHSPQTPHGKAGGSLLVAASSFSPVANTCKASCQGLVLVLQARQALRRQNYRVSWAFQIEIKEANTSPSLACQSAWLLARWIALIFWRSSGTGSQLVIRKWKSGK